MPDTTNQLRDNKRRVAVSLAAASALLFGVSVYTYHPLRAALSPSVPTPPAALSDGSVSALVSLDQSVEAVAARVTPAVVNIAVTAHAPEEQAEADGAPAGAPEDQQGGDGDPMQEFQRFFGQGGGQGYRPEQPRQQQIEHGIGSGVIVSPDGYIVTNNHVVNGAMEIRVTLHDRRTFPAKVIGTDKLTDLAVIKINASGLPSLPWGNSAGLKPGESVLAFGSPFGYFQFSVTRGIVSALDRPNPYSDDARKPGGFIQTDAAINPGNSGGPLVDAHGEVIGINTFLISDSGSFAGAGFAIPSQIARPIVASLIEHGKVEHGYLGVGINDVTPDNAKFFDDANANGAVITQVSPNSPAGRAGLRAGDVVTAINGQPVMNASELQMAVSEDAAGNSVALDVLRDGKPQQFSVTLGKLEEGREVAASVTGSQTQSGKLGLSVANLNSDARQQLNLPDQLQGVVIAQVRPGSPAEDAGLASGDVILEVDRKPVDSTDQFRSEIGKAPSGEDILLRVWSRGGASYRVLHTSSTEDGM